MFKSTKALGYFILGLGVFLVVGLLVLIHYGYYNFLFFAGLVMVVFSLIIPFNRIFFTILKLIELDLYVGDTISTYYSKNREDEEDAVLIKIQFGGPVLDIGDGVKISNWANFIYSNVGYVDTKAHVPSKRRVEKNFTFHLKEMDKIKEFIVEMQESLEKEDTFQNVSVDFFYKEEKNFYPIDSISAYHPQI